MIGLVAVGDPVQLKDGRITQVKRILTSRKTGEVAIQDPDGGIHLLEDCQPVPLPKATPPPDAPAADPPPRDPKEPIVDLIPGDRCKVCRGSHAGQFGTVLGSRPGGYRVRLDGSGVVVDASYFQLGLTDWDPLSRTITADEWGSLKAAAACLGLSGADLLGIVKAVTGQTRGSLITLRQMEQIWDAAEQLYLSRNPEGIP
jgi:AraC-like DNA-binding protein